MARKRRRVAGAPPDVRDALLEIDDARQEAIREFDSNFSDLVATFFAALLAAIASLRAGDTISIDEVAGLSGDLESLLDEAGLNSLIEDFARSFTDVVGSAADYFEAVGGDASLSAVGAEPLASWVDATSSGLAALIVSALVTPVRGALLETGLRDVTPAQLAADVATLRPQDTPRPVRAFVDESYGTVQRAVINKKADELGLEIYQFLGPDDAITSDQCHTMLHVDRHGPEAFLYKDEITPALHPFLERYGIEPLHEGGHPGCRHVWAPVTEEFAISKGFKVRGGEN